MKKIASLFAAGLIAVMYAYFLEWKLRTGFSWGEVAFSIWVPIFIAGLVVRAFGWHKPEGHLNL